MFLVRFPRFHDCQCRSVQPQAGENPNNNNQSARVGDFHVLSKKKNVCAQAKWTPIAIYQNIKIHLPCWACRNMSLYKIGKMYFKSLYKGIFLEAQHGKCR
jgi:hypothetical protein